MKKYIWNLQVAADNPQKIGQGILFIIMLPLMCTCPAPWLQWHNPKFATGGKNEAITTDQSRKE